MGFDPATWMAIAAVASAGTGAAVSARSSELQKAAVKAEKEKPAPLLPQEAQAAGRAQPARRRGELFSPFGTPGSTLLTGAGGALPGAGQLGRALLGQ